MFFSGGYNAGSVMMRIKPRDGGGFEPEVLYRLSPDVFGATQQTPIFHKGNLYGIRPDGQMVCLGLDGKILWASGVKTTFGLGPFVIADDLLYALDDDGHLAMMRAVPDAFELLGATRILEGSDAWGPMAIAGGRLIARDLRKMVCVEVRAP